MVNRSLLSRTVLGALGTALGLAAVIATARASEIDCSAQAHGFTIHGPLETLRDYCHTDPNQKLWLDLPGGMSFELVTSTADPAIYNPGDGEFHPFDEAQVRAALAAVSFPLGQVSAEVFLLPYPRRLGLESAAGPGLILLAPGVRPLTPQHQHAEFVHELGHAVQYALMPDADAGAWQSYDRLRGIQDASIFSAASVHADRPHEIFAEDFRVLFGDPLAHDTNSIENPNLQLPDAVPGLKSFIASISGVELARTLEVFPNPSRGALRFTRGGALGAALELYDVRGGRVASLSPTAWPGGTSWVWDGHGAAGRPVAPGVLFARLRGERGIAARVTIAP